MLRSLPLLDSLRAKVEARSRATQQEHAFWPCTRGCDHCCRTLPSLPNVTRTEWEEMRAAMSRMPPNLRASIEARIRNAPARGPLTCPLLDEAEGTCRIYEARPIACRTYGFYTEWDAGLHCDEVTRAVRDHDAEERVVWGNGEAIAEDMKPLGETKTLDVWLGEV